MRITESDVMTRIYEFSESAHNVAEFAWSVVAWLFVTAVFIGLLS